MSSEADDDDVEAVLLEEGEIVEADDDADEDTGDEAMSEDSTTEPYAPDPPPAPAAARVLFEHFFVVWVKLTRARIFDRLLALLPSIVTKIELSDVPHDAMLVRFTLDGEPAEDEGGVSREVYSIFFRSLLTQDRGDGKTFLVSEEGSSVALPPPMAGCGQDIFDKYEAVGIAIARAFIERYTVAPMLAPSLLRFLELGRGDGEDGVLTDELLRYLRAVDPVYARSMEAVADMTEKELAALDMGASGSPREYVARAAHEVLTGSRILALSAMRLGFRRVMDRVQRAELSKPCACKLQSVLSGKPRFTAKDVAGIVVAKKDKDRVLADTLCEAILSWDDVLLRDFLSFSTGMSNLPLKPRPIWVVGTSASLSHLPVAHTCTNVLDVPRYGSAGLLDERFRKAIAMGGAAFGLA
jgi:hypothetical protein